MILTHGSNSLVVGGGGNQIKIGDIWYPYIQLGNLLWLGTALKNPTSDPTLYKTKEGIDGLYYKTKAFMDHDTWDTTAEFLSWMPSGWRVPTESDYNNLISNVTNYTQLLVESEGGTNELDFNAQLGGFYTGYGNEMARFGTRFMYAAAGSLGGFEGGTDVSGTKGIRFYGNWGGDFWESPRQLRLCCNAT